MSEGIAASGSWKKMKRESNRDKNTLVNDKGKFQFAMVETQARASSAAHRRSKQRRRVTKIRIAAHI